MVKFKRNYPQASEGSLKHITIFVNLFFSMIAYSQTAEIRVQAPEDPKDQRPIYFRKMLQLALDKTAETDGPARWVLAKNTAIQERNIKSLQANRNIDVLWTMTNNDRESRLLPVRIPLYKGLFGYRICIINQQDKDKFSSIKSVADFRKSLFKIGSGIGWPDTEILQKNNLDVVVGDEYTGLFIMLSKNRFDCYARAIPEPWVEIETNKKLNLIVDRHLVFKYPTAMYFFVNKANVALASRIERGLLAAIKDGSFDEIFYTHNKAFIDKSEIGKRVILELKNPILPTKTPLNKKDLWIKF